jgi:hypothetical protein
MTVGSLSPRVQLPRRVVDPHPHLQLRLSIVELYFYSPSMHTWYVKGDLYLYHSPKRFKDIGAGTWPPVFDNWNLKKRSWPIWGHCVVVCEEKHRLKVRFLAGLSAVFGSRSESRVTHCALCRMWPVPRVIRDTCPNWAEPFRPPLIWLQLRVQEHQLKSSFWNWHFCW